VASWSLDSSSSTVSPSPRAPASAWSRRPRTACAKRSTKPRAHWATRISKGSTPRSCAPSCTPSTARLRCRFAARRSVATTRAPAVRARSTRSAAGLDGRSSALLLADDDALVLFLPALAVAGDEGAYRFTELGHLSRANDDDEQ